jgi:hypothetical protein
MTKHESKSMILNHGNKIRIKCRYLYLYIPNFLMTI